MSFQDLSREDFLVLAKLRAAQYLVRGDLSQAWNSLISDLNKHPATAQPDKAWVEEGFRLAVAGDARGFRDWLGDLA